MIHIKAPSEFDNYVGKKRYLTVFLAGSIEMGAATKWQDKVASGLEDYVNVVLLNPRRDDWNSDWIQKKSNPKFFEQVNWELDAQEEADCIIMYFDEDTKSPITLAELGLFARSGKVIVCCPEDYWKEGNVDIICDRYGVKQVNSLEQLIAWVGAIANKKLEGY
jgi:nucleoside 2-deoxyribosyltransferase